MIKALTTASLGLLRKGVKKALTTASLGLLRFDDDQKPQKPLQTNDTKQPSGVFFDYASKKRIINNNNVVLLTISSEVI